MKILLINQGKTENYGDIAICNVMESSFKNLGYETNTIPYCDEEATYGFLWKSKLFRKIILRPMIVKDIFNKHRIHRLIRDKKEIDAAIIGGGELLSSHKEFNSCMKSWIYILNKQSIPVFAVGISGDANMNNYLLSRYRKALSLCKRVIVRDKNTLNVCKKIYHINGASCFPDVVFSKKVPKVNKNGEEYISIVTPAIPSKKAFEKLKVSNQDQYFECYLRLVSPKANKIIVAPSVKNDSQTAKELFSYFEKHTDKVVEYAGYSNLDTFEKMLSESNQVVSARMHPMILGLLYENDIAPIRFKEKLILFEKEYCRTIKLNAIVKSSRRQFDIIDKEIKNGQQK